MTTHGWQLTKTRWGWRWKVYQYGKGGHVLTGWRPGRRWAGHVMRDADRKLCRMPAPTREWELT